ncbi:UDP-3-O-(3-hydroxymyristoyl)glucosamine N-acyltransferase [Caballeronia sp. SEWSISQ10-4 2]|uniref:UDP-3-O-(3-hydroxymyristoyl)glucosamine N-acyltransferase n=1 Tax=Caballeronia sp. SEWSISQ10-4 2 TaxID=2937438 RepID=UPI002654BBFF|nr:UDP-3-O-(3-hydroxymyristoyl)glucosamine N-acyltransferase [Caballeronia sp. SEWSISQ10-4 2]MDN7179162.1 UDP-3-O-(3-hydroxymyristoyl)glucosamine N-acyltransferase [Caballeronia sp. SEWSISQ10-4 2]
MNNKFIVDARFYARSGPYNLAEVAVAANGTADASDRVLTGVAPLQHAGPAEVSFLDNSRYASLLEKTGAGAVIVHPDMVDRVPSSAIPIVTAATYEGWARVAALFHPVAPPNPGIHPTAFVAPGVVVDPTAEIGAFACIEGGVQIGPRCRIGSYVSIGSGVVIGEDCRIGAHVSISHASLGARVSLLPGARIGQEGFGFARTRAGFLTIPHLGRVVIENDVEIGANSTIDRGSIQDTVIGAGSRIDNLVQIGHNVRLGRCCVIVAQVGISGSTVLEDFVQVGGQAAMAGHLRIGCGAQIGAQSGVISDVPAAAILLGSPAQSRYEFFRQVVALKRMVRRPR